MAVLRRRDLTSRIPEEVLARVERGGVGRDGIDWYAGRQAETTAHSRLSSTPDSTRVDLERIRGEHSRRATSRTRHRC